MKEHVLKCKKIIQAGGLIIYPTEGLFGIGCDPDSHDALAKLISLKKRSTSKGIILIASRYDMLNNYIEALPSDASRRVLQTWPGPVSWVLPAKKDCSRLLTGGHNTIVARVSSHPFVQALCGQLGHAITSTSANISGQAPICNFETLEKVFAYEVDFIVPLMPGNLERPTSIFDALSGRQLR